MTAWAEISLQQKWWVPQRGWEKWAATRDLKALLPTEKLAISSMSQEHRISAATLLLSHARNAILAVEETIEPHLVALAASKLDIHDFPPRTAGHLLQRTRIATALFAVTPLCEALLAQPALIHPLVTADLLAELNTTGAVQDDDLLVDLAEPALVDPLVTVELFAEIYALGETETDFLMRDLLSSNDARSSLALRTIARRAVKTHKTLLTTLLADGVLLHDALSVQHQVHPL
jgi:hypothetical protein